MTTPISSAVSSLEIFTQPKPGKIEDAAQQFESLLIAQMLQSGRESAPGSLGDEDTDSETSAMQDLAGQQFAQALAKQGGLGLSRLLIAGLHQNR
jgi:Rod binding domain-containing protein